MLPVDAKADNPITRPRWRMPKAQTPGNFGGGSTACNPNLAHTNLAFGDCFSQNTMFLRMTGAISPTPHPTNSMMYFLEDLVQEKLLRSRQGGSAPAATFATFLDLTLKRFLDANTNTTIDYNPTSYLYRPVTAPTGPYKPGDPGCVLEALDNTKCANRTVGTGGYEASALLDRTCIDIPLVGSVCLNGYLYDVNNDIGQVFFTYDYATATFGVRPLVNTDVESASMDTAGLCTKVDPITLANPCGIQSNVPAAYRDDDDGLQVHIKLDKVKLDLFFEPPTDTTGTLAISDVVNDTANATYDPAKDLSTYLKAYGVAELGTVDLYVAIRVAANYNNGVQPHTIGVGLELQSLSLDTDFQFVFQKGPYCNNNLGTTETRWAGNTYIYNDTAQGGRPFTTAGVGVARYAGLISDVAGGTVQRVYYAQHSLPVVQGIPHAASNMQATAPIGQYYGGGSGIGRDRIGVGANPYEFNNTAKRWSDHPLNCKFPADACSVTTAQAGGNATKMQQGGPEWNGNSASCEYPNTSNNSDDATYKISEQITSIIPYIQGELKVVATDKFKLRTRGNPGYYLGPTSLLDLGATLADISFDWPLRPQTDYVFIDALMDSDVDQDSTNEFWADQWGVMMPFNFALGVSWVNNVRPFYGITSPTNRRLDLGACVQALPVVTGYRDGIGEFTGGTDGSLATMNKNDDPFLTKTRGNKGLNIGTGSFTAESYQGLLAGFGFPAVTTGGLPPVAFQIAPAGAIVAPPNTTSYALGFAVHQNILSAAVYDAVVKGLLCADLDATGQYNRVTDQVLGTTTVDLLNTSTFQLFFPALYDKFPDRPMRIRVVPLLQKYKHNTACAAGNCGEPGMSSFTVTSAVNKLPGLMQANSEAPYVIMGGPPIGLSLIQSGVPYAYQDVATNTKYIYPDLTVVIPNLLIEFYVYGQSPADQNWYRVFAIDMGVAIGLNIDIVSTPATFVNLGQPVTGQTYFPVGCDPRSVAQGGPAAGQPSYCSGGSAYTKRVLRLAGLADPEINAIIEYSELTYGQAGTAGTASSPGNICGKSLTELPTEPGDTTCTGTQRPVSNAWTNPSILKGAISNLIGLVLSVDVNALVEVGFDLGAFLNIPLAIDAPYIGPSYAVSPATNVNITDNEVPTPNGFGDYLVGGLTFDLSKLSPSYLIQQINYLLDGTSSTKPFGIDGLDIALAPGSVQHDAYIPVPQATIQPPVKVSAEETVFRFAGYDAHDGSNVQYSWRVDNGVWSVFTPSNEARLVGLLEGKHTMEVKAINSKNMMQNVPARYTFVVDSIAPKVRVVGDRTVGSRASFFVESSDWLTPKEDVRVAYRLDDGRWSNFGYNKKISLSGLREGRHTLRVRASDNAGNTAESAFNFSASEGGFGCSTAPGAGSLADVLVMLVIPALVLLRKRLF
jgi:hypothetical protein